MSNNLQPGYRFYPTEEELLSFYLHNKLGSRREADMERVIPVSNICNFDPWQLPQISGEPCIQDSEQWFFFCPRQEREIHGGRPTRTAPSGYWKATGSPSQVYSSTNRLIGVKKTMVFYIGRAPNGTKTKWKMNEYRAIEKDPTAMPDAAPKLRKEFSLCRVYKNLGCLRSFDRRPSVASTASASRRVPDASSNDDGNQSGRKRTRSQDSSSRDDNGSSHGSLHDDLKMLEDIDWEQLDCL